MKNNAITGILAANKRYYLLIASTVPLIIWSCLIYGAKSVRLVLAAAGASLALHALCYLVYKVLLKKERFAFDLSAAVSGLLLALSLPVTVSYPVLLIGCAVAILSKELFGGLGRNPLNPALLGRVFVGIFFREQTTVERFFDTYVDNTPIRAILENNIPETSALDLFLGRADGNMGQISALLLILVAAFLIFNKVITWQAPLAMILSAGVLSVLIAPDNISYFHFTAGHLLGGGLLFAAVYFACDPVTTPHTSTGKLIFGAVIGALSVACRIYLGYEGLYLIILLCGLWSPLIDRMLRPSVFGGIKFQKTKEIKEKAVKCES